MEYTIAADAEFLRVKLWGRNTDQPPSEVCAEVLKESARLNRGRILIELDQFFSLSPASQFELVTRLPQIGLMPPQKIALLHGKQKMREENEFINVVAQNRGIPVRNFSDMDSALAWLRS